jgi:hypothetical protein
MVLPMMGVLQNELGIEGLPDHPQPGTSFLRRWVMGDQASDPSRPDDFEAQEGTLEQVAPLVQRDVFIQEKGVDSQHGHHPPLLRERGAGGVM